MMTNRTSGPLAGIRVVDLSNMISGPLATMILGDQGADVIKVEAPGLGIPCGCSARCAEECPRPS